MSDNNDNEIIVAAVALVVSVVAFAATLMQCLQQYYASARGYSQCNEKVMGAWAGTKKRHFNFQELRFEVEFDAPVIFVCPPGNVHGPVPNATIYELDGSEKSMEETWTTLKNMNDRAVYAQMKPKQRIHTADNERAGWTTLLSAVQYMEQKSRVWHEEQFQYDKTDPPPNDKVFTSPQHLLKLPSQPSALVEQHTLVVALQKKRKSWDTMPANIIKPYATTTMCHLVEMLAALGVYWRVFDRRSDRYRAEGNGFMVLGERQSDLGLIFSFQINGGSTFGRKRVIPVDEIKELCFGWVPTIYRSEHDMRRLNVPDDLFDLTSLRMGSPSEIAETLMIIGCNKNAINHYQGLEGSNGRASHLFNLSFEILGMLSQTFHIPDTFYTYIPNPTPDSWDRRTVSLPLMVKAYKEHFEQTLPGRPRNNAVVAKLNHHIDEIIEYLDESEDTVNNRRTLYRFRALHDAIATADEILTGNPRPQPAKDDVPTPTTVKADTEVTATPKEGETRPAAKKMPPTKEKVPGLDQARHQRERRIMVQDVLRAHIQEVLRLLNDRDARVREQQLLTVDFSNVRPQSRGRNRSISPSPSHADLGPNFEDMDEASPDERQHKMMEVYFQRVRRGAVPRAKESAVRRQSNHQPARSRRGSDASLAPSFVSQPTSTHPLREVINADEPVSPIAQLRAAAINTANNIDTEHAIDSAAASPRDGAPPAVAFALTEKSLGDQTITHDDIWCTLVFRMICWLMLHDFSKTDQQIARSELLGSRMPVYIM